MNLKKLLTIGTLTISLCGMSSLAFAGPETLMIDIDDYLLSTTSEQELSEFTLKYAKRSNPEITQVVFSGTPDEGTKAFRISLYDDIFVTSHIENARVYGVKVGSATLKYLNIPLQIKEFVYKDSKWNEVGKFKCVGEEYFKHEPRVIVKNALNDIINYYTSPNQNFVRGAIFNPNVHKQERGSVRF